MSASTKKISVKLGDVVEIQLPFQEESFSARVLKVGENMNLHTIVEYKPIEKVGRRDTGLNLCNIDFVVKVVRAAPYVCEVPGKENVFDDINLECYAHRFNRRIRTGMLDRLCMAALSTVTHVELKNPIRDEASIASLYEKDGCPGRVSLPADANLYGIAVNWKVFQKWVHANALRLIMTRKENYEKTQRLYEESMREAMDDMDEVMDRAFA